MENKYIIIPGCSDLNRGDQALVWETKRIAQDAGMSGKFYLTAEKNEPTNQSEKMGIEIITPIIEHPSRVFKNKENIRYSVGLKCKWGMIAIVDLLTSVLYFNTYTRRIVKKFIRKDKKESLDIMEKSSAFFVKGGGLLQTYGGLTSTYSMYFWVYHILLAKSMKKPIYVMPNSYGPFEGPFVKKIARFALNSCTLVTSRETYSQKMVKKELDISIGNYPDLAFYLPMSELNKEEVFSKYNLNTERKLVAITMRPHRFAKSSTPEEDYKRFKSEMAKFVRWLYNYGYMPVIIEHTLAVNSHENDGACIKDVIAMLDEKEYRVISDDSYNCYDLKCIYSYCDYIIGTRFHSVIFSLSSGIPGIAITYAGNKGQGIMHDIGLDEYTIGISDVRAEILKEKFTLLIRNEVEAKNKIERYLVNARKLRSDLVSKIKNRG